VGSTSVYEAGDSSHLQLIEGSLGRLFVHTTDGTTLTYDTTSNGYRCTQIKDRNGNYLTITNDSEGRLQTVTDTLGRVFTVNYDEYHNPLSITQTRGTSEYTWATFGYDNLELEFEFDGPSPYGAENHELVPVLNQVGLPDGSYYTFDYNGYAQVKRVNYYAADDSLLNYIGNDLGAADSGSPTDCPRIGAVSVLAKDWNVDDDEPQPVTTTFAAPVAADCSGSGSGTDCLKTVVKAPELAPSPVPNELEQRTYYRAAGSWDYGLPVLDETWAEDDSSPTTMIKQRWVTTTWDQENTSVGYMLNPRVTDTSIFDSGNQKRTTIGYEFLTVNCGSGCSTVFALPNSVTEYKSNASTELRTTETDYLESTNYLDRRIIGLPVEKRVYDGTNSGTLMAKTGFYYDETGFLTAQGSSIPQFDATNFGDSFYYRGNLTKVRQYEIGTSNTKDSKIGYNTTGSLILTRDPLSHDHTIEYSDTYKLAYPTTLADADENETSIAYNFYTGQKTRTEDPAPEDQTHGRIMAYTYDTADRLYTATRVKDTTTDANSVYYYATSGTNVTGYTTIKDLSTYTVASTITDGAGRTIATATEHPGSSGGYKAQAMHYDRWGRADMTSNPTEINSGFGPVGDDYYTQWKYTKQTYDWKNRPLITTNPDNTTRLASYSGCGCAGGDVVTLEDEGTTIGGTPTRRKQKIYNDVLGRTYKTETYNWDGSTPYQTVVTSFDVLDRPTLSQQYAGSQGSGTPQETNYTYDGYGRLYYSRTPSQTANTYYSYYADDRLYRRTDGRGAYRNFTYNNRGQVTGITYGSTVFGMTLPSTVSFDYDNAGNRTLMEDGQGSVSYEYDQFSRMTSETRDFDDTLANAPDGVYKLSYTYNLNGSLASLKDPFNDEVDYAIDEAGRLTGVTGSSYGGITSYADNAGYRASNVLKHLEYGNGQTMDATFNSRMAPTSYQVTDGTHNVLNKTYVYYDTGQVRYSQDLLNAKFDRLYEFDQVGRIATAKSGAEARGSTDYPENIPYRQTYSYDSFGHLTGRSSNHWIASYSISDTYASDRNDNWTYDAAGNLLVATDQTNTLDAAERVTKVEVTNDSRTTQKYDGLGQVVHQRRELYAPPPGGGGYYLDSDKYLIRSTVLGGEVVTETNDSGGKVRSFVYAGGTVIAWQTDGTYMGKLVNWMHQEPGGASSRSTDSAGAIVVSGLYGAGSEPAELDPMRADTGLFNPYFDPGIPPDDGSGSSSQSSTAFGSPWHQRATFSVDGIRVEPETFMQIAAMSMQSPFNMLIYFSHGSRLVTGTRYYDEQWTKTTTVRDGPDVTITSRTAHEYWSEPIFGNESWSLSILITLAEQTSNIADPQNLHKFKKAIADPNGPSAKQKTSIDNAAKAVGTILAGNNPCATFFGGSSVALAAFNSISFTTGTVLEESDIHSGGDTNYTIGISMSLQGIDSAAIARGYVKINSAIINTNGAFFLKSYIQNRKPEYTPNFGGYGPTTIRSQILQMLHELGHVVLSGRTNKLPLDGTNNNLSDENTDAVLQACRTEIEKYK
jgi:YD repeat-containing protein